MPLAEDLLLLLTDDRSGRLSVTAAQVDIAVGGANLVELTLAGKIDLTGEGDQGRPGRMVVRDAAPPGDPVLDTALQTLVALSGIEAAGGHPPAQQEPAPNALRAAGGRRDREGQLGVGGGPQSIEQMMAAVVATSAWAGAAAAGGG